MSTEEIQLAIRDHRRSPSDQERPIETQSNGSVAFLEQPSAAHRHTSAEQPSRAVGTAELPPSRSLQLRRGLQQLVREADLSGRRSRARSTSARHSPSVSSPPVEERGGEATATEGGEETLRSPRPSPTAVVQEDPSQRHRPAEQQHRPIEQSATVEHPGAIKEVCQSSVHLQWGRGRSSLHHRPTPGGQLWQDDRSRSVAFQTARTRLPRADLLSNDPDDGHPGRLLQLATVLLLSLGRQHLPRGPAASDRDL